MIRVEGLNFYYMIGENILEDISFTAEKGEIIGILGANGVGKTTLLKLLCGLQKETDGSFELYGIKNNDKLINSARKKMGAVVETPSIFLDLTKSINLISSCTIA